MMKRLGAAFVLLLQFSAETILAFQPFSPFLPPRSCRFSSSSFRLVLASASPSVEEVTVSTTEPNDVARIREATIADDIIQIETTNAFDLVAGRASICLLESDIRRDAIGKGAGKQASSATNWIHDGSAYALKQALNGCKLALPNERTGMDRDEATAWYRWLVSTPTPTIINLDEELRTVINATLTDRSLDWIDEKRTDFLSRLSCRLVLLPSGAELNEPLVEPAASIVYGKLLYGGVTRSRLLRISNSARRTGVRTSILDSSSSESTVWMMYGGPNRMYQAVDMGPAAVLEVVLLPRGKELNMGETKTNTAVAGSNMMVNGMVWKPQDMFGFVEERFNGDGVNGESTSVNGYQHDDGLSSMPSLLSGRDRNEAFRSDFSSSIGGLQPQIESIVRRVLDGRVIRPATDEEQRGVATIETDDVLDEMDRELTKTAVEAAELTLLGLTPVRGLLLYGPPGCGKTALAREISKALRARAPKIVSAPELLDRWVGGSEKLVRELFVDAESELRLCRGDATKSALHVIVIDEIDAVFRKRSNSQDSGEATRSSVVNQILSKLDGVNAIPNVLLIGMTNRRELLDVALLRPGRLEVQIEIPKPDRQGRREILRIHFRALRDRGRLSQPLCCAIDGVRPTTSSRQRAEEELTQRPESQDRQRVGKRQRVASAISNFADAVLPSVSALRPAAYDLAADSATGGFSGADIAGLVRCAGSIALARCRVDGAGVEGLLITLEDVKQALSEVH